METGLVPDLASRLGGVRERIARAAARSGRPASTLRLVPVTKTFSLATVNEAYALGLREFGESRVQELCAKAPLLPSDVRWHLVGPLQRKKARKIVGVASCVQALDDLRVAETLAARARDMNLTLTVLIEVNTSGEAAKHGVAPEAVVEEVAAVAAFEHLRVEGLMTVGPTPPPGREQADERAARVAFQLLRQCAQRVAASRLEGVNMRDLSMGMSGDFEWAIEEGATLVRIGTALFGTRRG